MLNRYEITDIRDLAEFLLDSDNDADERARIADLFEQLGVDPESPDDEGETVIPESCLKEYARQLAEDIGSVPSNRWPLYCIDWDQAARELSHDMMAALVDGTTYYLH